MSGSWRLTKHVNVLEKSRADNELAATNSWLSICVDEMVKQEKDLEILNKDLAAKAHDMTKQHLLMAQELDDLKAFFF